MLSAAARSAPATDGGASTAASAGELRQRGEVDLRGLWSSSWLGHERRWWSKPVGGGVLVLLLVSWVGGVFSPAAVVALAYCGCPGLAAGLATVLAFPYMAPKPTQPWAAAMRFWMLGAHYFDQGCSMSFEAREPNDLSVPQMTCYHPHGIFVFGLVLNSGFRHRAGDSPSHWREYCGARVGPYPHVGLISSLLVKAPIFAHVVTRWSQSAEPVSKACMTRKMRRGESFGVVVGGFDEASLFVRGRERVFLRERKGFIKYALQYGYKVCPAYTFGESNTYWNLCRLPHALRTWLNRWGIPTVAPFGRWWLPLLPHGDKGLHTVVGSGRQFPKLDRPSAEQIDEYHQWYISALQALFDTHKWRFGLKDAELEVL